ncbi:aminotransferase [Thermaurantimonas aggregans]|uniref:Aminotransferase n=1 Tax=Thermaurantimonas aggregans TaxID=2173829 RepID=A0A401XNL4_9FLAO|nr:pyridoxal phosphate-dependent aminotransferase [Thermaurantimonas aggregans]MCX8148029.1 pyridoxal phosphate-dependent aminotransferase [Thermaurantimonas aggregans]GCD78607.1 aminotransferase [Thermaurantimonas aggregans]
MNLSERITNLHESQTLAMARKSRELKAQGIQVINLSLGEPDFNTPDFIKEAAKRAIDENYSHYSPVSGYADLREVISKKFARDNGLTYSPDEIVVSTGAKQSLINVVMCLVNPGDEVIILAPYWVSYTAMVQLAGGIPVFVSAGVEQDYKPTAEQIERAITPRTKLLLFSTPCNPTGSVFTYDELSALADVLRLHPHVFAISDEIYEHIIFDEKHISLASFEGMRDRVITVNGLSKGFAMTGWRIGFIGAPREIAQACDKYQGQYTSGTCTISQRAAIAALEADPSEISYMKDAFLRRRDIVLDLLGKIPGFKVNVPKGAFYVFPDVSELLGKRFGDLVIRNTEDLCMYFLNQAHVSLVTGDAFGAEKCIRISYAASETDLIEAIARIHQAVNNLTD